MPSILPVEKYRTTARAQFLANQILPRAKEQAMTPLREIIEQRRLSALFQPIIDLKSGEFLGFEGLIRGPADSPLHSPINLFGAAEQQGLQLELEMLSRQIVLETFAKLNLPGNLFLNVSPETLTNPSFKDGQTLAFLRQLGLDPERVIIEITENQPTFDFEGDARCLAALPREWDSRSPSTIWAKAFPACACGRSCARSSSRSTCISCRVWIATRSSCSS